MVKIVAFDNSHFMHQTVRVHKMVLRVRVCVVVGGTRQCSNPCALASVIFVCGIITWYFNEMVVSNT